MTEQSKYDVFLCHNSEDKPEILYIAEQLKKLGIRPWLDEWEFRPGVPWQQVLEQQISEIQAAAVFVGKNAVGPWQRQEIDAFLRKFVKNHCPVIPVLLKDAPQQPELPIFLEGLMWVDFRRRSPNPMSQLVWGITGEKLVEKKLEELRFEKTNLELKLKELEEEIRDLELQIKVDDPDRNRILIWLSNRKTLARKYGSLALKPFPNLSREAKDHDDGIERFYLEIESYLELVYYAVRTQEFIYLDEPRLLPSLADDSIYENADADVYQKFFELIKGKIPETISQLLFKEVESYLDYLENRLFNV
ncbi:MAG: TIR domain-containing protein [Elainellaceae cyanobacterium]